MVNEDNIDKKALEEHKELFEKIVIKYGLHEKEKAEEIAKFLTKSHEGGISFKEFASLFAMDENDTKVFLSFIQKGLEFKENNIDKK